MWHDRIVGQKEGILFFVYELKLIHKTQKKNCCIIALSASVKLQNVDRKTTNEVHAYNEMKGYVRILNMFLISGTLDNKFLNYSHDSTLLLIIFFSIVLN